MRPSEALAAHRAELRQLVRRHDLSRPRVFGSVLSSTDTDQSDLDLLVDATATTTLFTLARLEHAARIARCSGVGSDTGVFAPEGPGSRAGAGGTAMKDPERVEDYLAHVAETALC